MLKELSFYCLTAAELIEEYHVDNSNILSNSSILKNYITSKYANDTLNQLNFRYVTETQFNTNFNTLLNEVELAVFHLNVRSLNSHHRQLCQFLQLVCVKVWSYNINFYHNILPGYSFHCDLPVNSCVGGIGMYIKNDIISQQLLNYRLNRNSNYRIEDLWFEIVKNNKK
jgi:hypothetical protein